MAAVAPSPKRQARIESLFRKQYASHADKSGTCSVCQKLVSAEHSISLRSSAGIKVYCECHFSCENCEDPIPLGSSYVIRSSYPYCKNCVSVKVHACHLCQLPIIGDSIEALGVSWHLDHFLCHECHVPLTKNFGQDGFYIHNDHPYCEADYLQIYQKESEKKDSTTVLLSPQKKDPRKSPFASPKALRRKPKGRGGLMRSSSPSLKRIERQTSTIRQSNTFKPPAVVPVRRLLEQEKRASFLLQKETPAEYVHIRSSLSFGSTSEVTPRRPSFAESQSQESIMLEPMRTSGVVIKSKQEQEDSVIGKKILPESELVKDLNDVLSFCDIVGKGGFATVREAITLDSQESVAVKIFNKWQLSDEALIFIKREIGTLSSLSHPNIRQFRKLYEDKHYLYVVMEYIKGESLYDYVERVEMLKEDEAKCLVRSLLQVLHYIHSKGFIHQDVKTENILLPKPTDGETICFSDMKLIDFGFCRALAPGEFLREYCGSYHYLAPEMISREPYNFAVDLWSVGVVLYIVLSGLRPFFSQEEARQAKIQWFEEDWEAYSTEARELVIALLNPDATTRLTAEQALQHPWFTK